MTLARNSEPKTHAWAFPTRLEKAPLRAGKGIDTIPGGITLGLEYRRLLHPTERQSPKIVFAGRPQKACAARRAIAKLAAASGLRGGPSRRCRDKSEVCERDGREACSWAACPERPRESSSRRDFHVCAWQERL